MEIDLSKPILDLNERLAAENRTLLDEHGVFVLDLMASPGAGKTSTILATIAALRDRYRIAVIEGDIATQGRRREGQGARHPGGADQHRRRLPSRERHDQARDRRAAARRARPHHHRERRQPRVPDRLLPRRERQGHDPLGAGGPRQAVQVPGHLPDLRGRHPQQGRHDAGVRLRRGGVHRRGALAQPQGADLPHRRHEGRGRRRVGRVARRAHRRRQGRARREGRGGGG